jgi:hypothetical protein
MAIVTDTYQLKLIFTAPVLGTQPSLEASFYVARRTGHSFDEDELATLSQVEQQATRFHRLPGEIPALMSYHLLGFFKEAGKALNGRVTGQVRNLRAKVSQLLSVSPRLIALHPPQGAAIEFFERPLRTEVNGMPRVAIARSELLPEGTWLACGLEVIHSELGEEVIRDLLDYGFTHGLGQWRGSGAFGTFRYELRQEDA